MDVLRTRQNSNMHLHPRIAMTMEGLLLSSRIVFTMKHLYYRGNLEGKLLFQQNDGDMAVVRLEQDQLVFIPVGVHPYVLSLSMRPSRQRILPPPKNPTHMYLVFVCSEQNYHINIAKMLWHGVESFALILSKAIQANILQYNHVAYTIQPCEHGQDYCKSRYVFHYIVGVFGSVELESLSILSETLLWTCSEQLQTSKRPQRQTIAQRFQHYYENNLDTIANDIEIQAHQDHLDRFGSNYFFMTDMVATIGILPATDTLPEVRYSYVLLDTTETPFGFSNSSRNAKGKNDATLENIRVDFDASVKTTQTIHAGDELRWSYQWSNNA